MSISATAQPDVTLFLDVEGVIREVAFCNALATEQPETWIGRRWVETVSDSGTSKVQRLVADARAQRVSAFRQVPQRFPSGIELLMEYTAVRLGPRSGLVAVGKNLQAVNALQASVVAAQQAVERDYWRLRNIETRYRLLFNASSEASVLLESSSLRVLEANAAAARALRPGLSAVESIEGREIAGEFAPADREGFLAMLHRVREHGSAPAILVHLARDRAPITVRASLLKSEPSAVFLLQLSAVGQAMPRNGKQDRFSVEALMERHPYGFVILRRDGSIVRANRAFLELVQIGAEAWAAGERLERWLDDSEAYAAMLTQVGGEGAGKVVYAKLRGQLGREIPVEITAALASDDSGYLSVLLRGDAPAERQAAEDSLLGSATAQMGSTTLQRSLSDTARAVERHCLQKALELRNGDSGAAALVLGLSLKSFRARLRQFSRQSAAPRSG
jgi:transcriptional regulator PpsR